MLITTVMKAERTIENRYRRTDPEAWLHHKTVKTNDDTDSDRLPDEFWPKLRTTSTEPPRPTARAKPTCPKDRLGYASPETKHHPLYLDQWELNAQTLHRLPTQVDNGEFPHTGMRRSIAVLGANESGSLGETPTSMEYCPTNSLKISASVRPPRKEQDDRHQWAHQIYQAAADRSGCR